MTSRLLMQQQDDTLDELDAAVTRVGYMADNIHEEVESQNKMMNEMQNDLEAAEEELGLVMGKLGDFLQTKDKWQLCTILSLFGVAVLLLLLVVYTWMNKNKFNYYLIRRTTMITSTSMEYCLVYTFVICLVEVELF